MVEGEAGRVNRKGKARKNGGAVTLGGNLWKNVGAPTQIGHGTHFGTLKAGERHERDGHRGIDLAGRPDGEQFAFSNLTERLYPAPRHFPVTEANKGDSRRICSEWPPVARNW
jgi:hypothetical protein